MIEWMAMFAAAFGYTPWQFRRLTWPDVVALAGTAFSAIRGPSRLRDR